MNIIRRGVLPLIKIQPNGPWILSSYALQANYRNIYNGIEHKRYPSISSASTKQSTQPYSSAALVTSKPNTLFGRLVKWLGLNYITKSKLRITSILLYEKVLDSVNYPEFFEEFNLPNTFYSWFLITELHVWMIMVRAMAENESGQFIRNCIVGAMWSDVNLRAKKLGPSSTTIIKKQIVDISSQFQYNLIAYDEGLMADDKHLASALWKAFFQSKCDNYEQIELLIKYIRVNIQGLDNLPTKELLDKVNLNFISLSDCKKDV